MPPKTLKLSDDLSLPVDAATQTFGFIGRKGSGKTYGAGKLTELLLDAGVQTIVLDTVGNWYGLRLAADGKGDGYDIPVLGGLRGDIPLNAAAGELVADIAADTGRSLVIDISQFSLADRKRFATAFATRLWQRKKAELEPTPLHLVIEESQLLIPQFVGKDDARMVGIFEEIVRLGRNYGIGCSLITQRPQSVNKEALTQVECLVVFQVNGVPERKALRDWITAKGLDVDLVAELPGLPIGTPYVWSPQWLDYLGKVKIAEKKTYDSTATPKVGEKRVRREPKPLDLAALEERMGALIEEKKASDPRELRKRIADLEKQLSARPTEVKVETTVERVEVPVLTDDHLARLHQAVDMVNDDVSRLTGIAEEIVRRVQAVVSAASRTAAAYHPPTPSSGAASQKGGKSAGELAQKRESNTNPHSVIEPVHRRVGGVSGPQQRILDALAAFDGLGLSTVDRRVAAAWSKQSPRSSGFEKNISTLRTAGLIDYPSPGLLTLTAGGKQAANHDSTPLTLRELHEAWIRLVSGPQGRMLRALIDHYPGVLTREQLAMMTDQSIRSSGFEKNVSTLRSLGLIDYPQRGETVATDLLFPEGLK